MKEGIPSYLYIVFTALVGAAFIVFLVWQQQGELDTREEDLVNLAEQIGADREQFIEDYQSDAIREDVEAQNLLGEETGVNATPTIVVDGEIVESNALADIQARIDQKIEDDTVEKPVLVYEYFDFQCPACAQFHQTALQLEIAYDDSEVEFRQQAFFIPQFNQEVSEHYAYAFEAARLQGLGEEMEAEIFMYHHRDSRYDYDLVQSLIESYRSEQEDAASEEDTDSEDSNLEIEGE